ncbi:hypothetical protein [Hyalangium versicolor]|uniref:hypothetical protein n=1 Tax=Hyalangium versicolor TaxID=2861190 RepID=UPI001CCB3FD2|nr:hypothetical protein [Hyalangium versicolor]
MLIIRDAQRARFEHEALDSYKEHLATSLKKHWPRHCSSLGDAELRFTVDKLINRALSYGFTARRDLFRYLNVAFLLGAGFDTAEDWARALLNDAKLSPADKIERLVARARAERR